MRGEGAEGGASGSNNAPLEEKRRRLERRFGRGNVAKFAEAVYVLHAFQKKSKQGIKTPQTDVKLIAERLKRAQADYESRGKP